MSERSIIAVAVGNTRARVGAFDGRELSDPESVAMDPPGAVAAAVARLAESRHGAPVVMSSVSPRASEALAAELEGTHGLRVLRIGDDLGVAMPLALDDASTLGQDRVLCAVGAYARSQQACVVVDAGTAITVDFVDGQGVFQGGVIAPGVSMMLGAMHAGTAQLPEVRLEPPDPSRGPFGKDTRHAMLLGVIAAARGLVRETVERYAEHYQAYPQIVATGGDAALLFDGSDLVEHIVPDLQLLGILEVWERAMRDSEEVEAGDDDQ